jgi:hypothetical protein
MTRRLHTRLWLTNSFLLEYVILEPEKEILQNRLTLLPSDLVVILARTIVLVPMYALARLLVPAKTPVIALTVAHSKIMVSRILIIDLPVRNTWSFILSVSVTGLSTW